MFAALTLSSRSYQRAATLFMLLALAALTAISIHTIQPQIPSPLAASYGQKNLLFTPNRGQAGREVLFQTSGTAGNISFLRDGALFQAPVDAEGNSAAVQLSFLGSSPQATVRAGEATKTSFNFLKGSDASAWLTGVPTYAGLTYFTLYPGIDLVYSGSDGALKSTFVVAPGAAPAAIRWQYLGAQALAVDPQSGDLIVSLNENARLFEAAPVAWQTIGGQRIPVEASFRLQDGKSAGFQLGSYDPAQPLFIDPTTVYENFLPSENLEHGKAITADSAGNAYVAGYSYDQNVDIKILKLDTHGDFDWITLVQTPGVDYATGIEVDPNGNPIVVGWTGSDAFPVTADAYQLDRAGQNDAFVIRLNKENGDLLYGTFFGGSRGDYAADLAVGPAGDVFLGGWTSSIDLPVTPNAVQGSLTLLSCFCDDAFIARLSADGSTLQYGTYLGGQLDDKAYALDLDPAGNIYLAGVARSEDFPLQNPVQSVYAGGDWDAFAAKVSANGEDLVYSTYLGGVDFEWVWGLAVHSDGSAYLAGYTDSANFPSTANAYQSQFAGGINECGNPPFIPLRNCYDVFISKVSPAGGQLEFGTFLGGGKDEEARSIALDSEGNAYVIGYTSSPDFPPGSNPYFTSIFASMVTASGRDLGYTLFLESNSPNAGHGISVDAENNVYITGAVNVPADIYVAKIEAVTPPPAPPPYRIYLPLIRNAAP